MQDSCKCTKDAQQTWPTILVCAAVWKSSCPVRFVMITAFAAEAYLLVGLYRSPDYRLLLSFEKVWPNCFSLRKSGIISISLPISSLIYFPNFFICQQKYIIKKIHLVTGLLWLFFCLIWPFVLLGTGATAAPFLGWPCSHSRGAPRRKVGGDLLEDKMAVGALFWAGRDPKWLKGSLWAERKGGCRAEGRTGWQPLNFGYLQGEGTCCLSAHLHLGWRWLFFHLTPNLGVT